jgi:hypothetical protein
MIILPCSVYHRRAPAEFVDFCGLASDATRRAQVHLIFFLWLVLVCGDA